MAIADISLTAGMRNNLLALQSTSAALTQTQNRLSSGKKVNSALDNPTNFFAAQSHLQRASDLGDRKDGMAEGIQTIKAADAGITSITSLIQAAKGLASSALGTTDVAVRKTYQDQFKSLLGQIDTLATDANYKGTNLLKGDKLTIQFSQKTGTTLDIQGFDASTGSGVVGAGLQITDPGATTAALPTAPSIAAANAAGSALTGAGSAGATLSAVKTSFDDAKAAQASLNNAATLVSTHGALADAPNALIVHNASLAAGVAAAAIAPTDAAAALKLTTAAAALETTSLVLAGGVAGTGTDALAASNAAAALNTYTVNTAAAATAAGGAANTATADAATATTAGDTLIAARLTTSVTDLTAAQKALTDIGKVTLATYDSTTNGAVATAAAGLANIAGTSVTADNGTKNTGGWDAAGAAGATNISKTSLQLEAAMTTLRSQSSSLASNLTVVTTRQDFTSNLISTLQTGADNLTLADMNQEGANMLALQTRQSLSTTALSLSSQAAQSILKLF